MSSTTIAERIRIESTILDYVREALIVALNAPIEMDSADQWCERCRFLTESFRRHVERLFHIKWEVNNDSLIFETEQPQIVDEMISLEQEQRQMLVELDDLTSEVHLLSPENPANLHAFHQRLLGYMERFGDMKLRECKLWLDAFQVDIGGEG